MCEQSIRDRAGKVWTGRLVDHRGSGVAEIDVDGVRHVGVKVVTPAQLRDQRDRWHDVTEKAGQLSARR